MTLCIIRRISPTNLTNEGPIIRISPYELHIEDPKYYDELYVRASRRRKEKYEWSVRGFGPTLYTFATVGHEFHRTRRGAVAPFFSKALVQNLEPERQHRTSGLCLLSAMYVTLTDFHF